MYGASTASCIITRDLAGAKISKVGLLSEDTEDQSRGRTWSTPKGVELEGQNVIFRDLTDPYNFPNHLTAHFSHLVQTWFKLD